MIGHPKQFLDFKIFFRRAKKNWTSKIVVGFEKIVDGLEPANANNLKAIFDLSMSSTPTSMSTLTPSSASTSTSIDIDVEADADVDVGVGIDVNDIVRVDVDIEIVEGLEPVNADDLKAVFDLADINDDEVLVCQKMISTFFHDNVQK